MDLNCVKYVMCRQVFQLACRVMVMPQFAKSQTLTQLGLVGFQSWHLDKNSTRIIHQSKGFCTLFTHRIQIKNVNANIETDQKEDPMVPCSSPSKRTFLYEFGDSRLTKRLIYILHSERNFHFISQISPYAIISTSTKCIRGTKPSAPSSHWFHFLEIRL